MPWHLSTDPVGTVSNWGPNTREYIGSSLGKIPGESLDCSHEVGLNGSGEVGGGLIEAMTM